MVPTKTRGEIDDTVDTLVIVINEQRKDVTILSRVFGDLVMIMLVVNYL